MANYSRKSNKQLEAILWKWFSLFIRLRNADSDGMVECITCGKVYHYKSMDAGHFVSRNNKSTKYNEKNVNVQCPYDNRFQSGNQYQHGIMIDKIYGEGTALNLMRYGNMVCKRNQSDLINMIEHYKQIVTSNPLFKEV